MRFARALPALLVALLLVLSLGTRGAATSPRASEAATAPIAGCDLPIQSGGSRYLYSLPVGGGITQPVGVVANVAACSLAIDYSYYNSARVDMVQWDPATLAPDPTTVALRTRTFSPSALSYGITTAYYSPPLVTRQFGPLADPPRGMLAINVEAAYIFSLEVEYRPDGEASTPAAYTYSPGGPRVAIEGPHPVLGHFLCGGEGDLQKLGIVQSVMTTNASLGTAPYELIQKFRVTQSANLHWVELAFTTQASYPFDAGTVAIYDGAGGDSPPTLLPAPLAQATFHVTDPYNAGPAVWGATFDFSQIITLTAGHDYWLFARTLHEYPLLSKTLTGTEGANFTAGVGPFFTRTDPTLAWSNAPSQALSFRLIGEPVATAGVRVDGPSRAAFALAAAPNPFRAAATLRWSGAAGAVWFEVIDPRGRRVASGEGAPGGRGEWTWRGLDDAGRALPAGVYFVRGTDDAGRSASVRVVRVR